MKLLAVCGLIGGAAALCVLVQVSRVGSALSQKPVKKPGASKRKTMNTPIDSLVERLGSQDRDAGDRALGELIQQGKAATPALLHALKSTNARVRELAAGGLSEIADPASAEGLSAALEDSNEKVRARAATGLARIKDPRSIKALIRTIDDFPDVLHNPYTPSVYTLMSSQPEVLPPIVPLLKSPDTMTRERAFAVLQAVVPRVKGQEKNWKALWDSLGKYDPNAPADARNKAADQWAAWIKQHVPGSHH